MCDGVILVSAIGGVRPYLSTPDGLTGDEGKLYDGGGCDGTDVGSGRGAGAPGAEGYSELVDVGMDEDLGDLEEKMTAVREAPATAEPAAIKANVVFDMISEEQRADDDYGMLV